MHRFELNALAITKSVYARSTVFVTVYIAAIFARNCARDDNRRSFRWKRIIERNVLARARVRDHSVTFFRIDESAIIMLE